MKIKDFNEKVRIGSTVYIGDRKVTVEDIDRRTHEAYILRFGWVRCSEFELRRVNLRERAAYYGRLNSKPLTAIFPNGKRKNFASATEAARQTGLSLSTISNLCRTGKRNRQGIGFEYVDGN